MDCSEVKIIRKLGQIENEFLRYLEFSNAVNVYKLETRIDFGECEDILRRALFEWKARDVLLRSKIHSCARTNEKYFALASSNQSIEESLHNVEFLRLENEDEPEELIKLVALRETDKRFDLNEGPLWRIVFIKLDKNETKSETLTYRVIFSIHHVIAEGRGLTLKLRELFEIVEAFYLQKNIVYTDFSTIPSLETVLDQNRICSSKLRPVSDFYFKVCNFPERMLDERNASSTNLSSNDAYLRDLNGNRVISLQKLLDSNSSLNQRVKFLKIPYSIFSQIVSKCKEKRAKVNACLNLILSVAIKSFYESCEALDELSDSIHFINSVSLRYMLEKEANYSSLGYLISRYTSKIESAKVDDYGLFWSSVRAIDREMQTSLKNNDHLRIFDWSCVNDHHDRMAYHFFLTNLGDLTPNATTSGTLIQIKERYATTNILETCRYGLFFVSVCTLNSELCLSINYSKKLFPNEKIVEKFASSILDISSRVAELA